MRTLHNLHTIDIAPGDLGITFRNGTKWLSTLPGEKIELCVCTRDPESHVIEGHGTVVEKWRGKFSEVPARLLENAHFLQCRTYSGLYAAMRNAYGDAFDEDSIIIALTYRRDD